MFFFTPEMFITFFYLRFLTASNTFTRHADAVSVSLLFSEINQSVFTTTSLLNILMLFLSFFFFCFLFYVLSFYGSSKVLRTGERKSNLITSPKQNEWQRLENTLIVSHSCSLLILKRLHFFFLLILWSWWGYRKLLSIKFYYNNFKLL